MSAEPPMRPPAEAPPESLEDVLVAVPAAGLAGATLPPSGPTSLKELFWAFTWLALQGFGGVLPVAQRELVERHGWLTREQFVEMLSISQVLPGPNVVNLALMFGDRHFGLRGAATALAGMLLVPMGVVLVLTALYSHFAQIPAVAGALRGMGAVAAGLVIATGFKLLVTLRRSTLGLGTGLAIASLMALGTGWLHFPLVWMLAVLGVVSCGLAWRKLGP